jgi:hypothetical protein
MQGQCLSAPRHIVATVQELAVSFYAAQLTLRGNLCDTGAGSVRFVRALCKHKINEIHWAVAS